MKKTVIPEDPFSKVSLPVTLLFNGYVIIWWLEVGKRIAFLGSIRLEFILGAVLTLVALFRNSSGMPVTGHHSAIPRFIWLYQFVLFASLPLAVDFDLAWKTFIDKNIKFALMTFFISQFVVAPRYLGYFFLSTFLAFLKVGQEAFVGKLTGSMVWENQGIPRLHGSPGTMFGHPNSLSGKYVSSLPFVWHFYPVLHSKWLKFLLGVMLIFAVNVIVYTGSRTGYVTFLAMCALIFFRSGKKLRVFLLFCLLAGVIVISLPVQYKARFFSSFSGKEVQGRSKDARVTLFKDSLTVFVNHPLGVGLYCFPVAQERAGRRKQETHNLYTQLLAETGMQGFLCFMSLLYIIHKEIRRAKSGFEGFQNTLAKISWGVDENIDKILIYQSNNCSFLIAVADAMLLFLYTRLCLGFFGHDLFEIYWWVLAGVAITLVKILQIMDPFMKELNEFLHSECILDR